ncbi:high affinity phosphate transporter (ISS) [Ectocarpus siliculosus]|uniref:High affinity phosphate transporter (ISS) n=1 Tax=Ectocarpus siliculosus TaxID=2880 RepID=D8LJQ5_ECTSI|nr:high affinity phosphate transporter (ISS) [Ectocarpus siliculosus]|eukprot:CBN77082.1 high affinity phosphate transporter (ISS) [Ectocarpus siliculosus]
MTAICDAFAHGANNVANATGPFEIILAVYIDGEVRMKGSLWKLGYLTLALGGFGIVAGLSLYGHKIVTAISVKISKITPSRGFSIEIGAALVMITGTMLGVPLSSTHCQVGATSGIALLEGLGGLNTRMVLKIMAGWAVTTAICGVSCALLFAQGVYAPFVFDTEE